jgi:hypothetical protein
MSTPQYNHLSASKPIHRQEFGSLPPGLDRRQTADEEARRDLTKSYEQLLADAHEEIADPNRTAEQNLGYSNRRLGSIFARSAMAADEAAKESSKVARENLVLQSEVRDLTRDLRSLTVQLKWFTVVLLFLAVVQTFYPIMKSFSDRSRSQLQQSSAK